MKWSVEIQKTKLTKKNLADLLSGIGFHVLEGSETMCFTSTKFDECDSPTEVFEFAKFIQEMLIITSIDPDFRLGAIVDYSFVPPKRINILEAKSLITGNPTIGIPSLSILPPKNLSNEELEKWKEENAEREYQAKLEDQRIKFEPAFRNKNVIKVLRLLEKKNPDGQTLNKIYELMEGHPKNRNVFQSQFDISKDQFKRFSDAVHNPKVTGDWARHAYDKNPKSNNPMSKDEAEGFIRQLAKQWIIYIRNDLKK